MAFKSETQPICRWCKRKIKKRTTRIYLVPEGGTDFNGGEFWRTIFLRPDQKWPVTKEEAQTLVNEKIISHSYHNGRIHSVGVWDGESYDDPYFCTGNCARQFAYAVAHANWPTEKTK